MPDSAVPSTTIQFFKAPSLQTRFILYLFLRTWLTLSKHTKHFNVYRKTFSKFTMTLWWFLCSASDVFIRIFAFMFHPCSAGYGPYGFLSNAAYFMPILHLRFSSTQAKYSTSFSSHISITTQKSVRCAQYTGSTRLL